MGCKSWEGNRDGGTDKGVESEPLSSFMKQYLLDKAWGMFHLGWQKCNYKTPRVEISDIENLGS